MLHKVGEVFAVRLARAATAQPRAERAAEGREHAYDDHLVPELGVQDFKALDQNGDQHRARDGPQDAALAAAQRRPSQHDRSDDLQQ